MEARLDPGTYYIGDLCYVLGDSSWMELVELTCPDLYSPPVDGLFCLSNGKMVAIFSTAHGDGTFQAFCGPEATKELIVDSGTIGCILVRDIEHESGSKLGHHHTFPTSFIASEAAGIISFGTVTVNTSLELERE